MCAKSAHSCTGFKAVCSSNICKKENVEKLVCEVEWRQKGERWNSEVRLKKTWLSKRLSASQFVLIPALNSGAPVWQKSLNDCLTASSSCERLSSTPGSVTSPLFSFSKLLPSMSNLERAALLCGHQDDSHQETHTGQAYPRTLCGCRAEHSGAAEPDQRLLPPRCHGEIAGQDFMIVAKKKCLRKPTSCTYLN